MATLGFDDLKSTALPTLWDAAELKKVSLQSGETMDGVAAEINRALQVLNGALLGMTHYADMISIQDDPELEYPIGVSNGFEEATEYGVPTPKRGDTTGHMLPVVAYDRSLGWTIRYLQKARRAKLDADIRSLVVDARNLWQQKILTRFFKMEGEQVGSTSNASVPFVDGQATDTKYVPPDSPEGESFAGSHDHYIRTATLNDTAVTSAIEHLQEHGHMSPFDIVASRADAGTWTGLTGFKSPEWPGIVYHASATERAAISEVSTYLGYFESSYGIARIWATPRVPTNYFGVFKTYGPGDTRNPLRIRLDPVTGFGYRLVPGNFANAPTHLLLAFAEFGIGVGEDRTNGVLTYIAGAGDYLTPTIS